MAPPGSSVNSPTPTLRASPASVRKRASSIGSNGGDTVAAIDRDDCAGDIGAGRRCEKDQRAIEVGRLGDALQRDAVDQRLAGRGPEELAVEVGLDIARRQRV